MSIPSLMFLKVVVILGSVFGMEHCLLSKITHTVSVETKIPCTRREGITTGT